VKYVQVIKMENGWYSSPNVLYIVIVKCFAVNRILTSSNYMKGMCVCVISMPKINVKFNCDQQYWFRTWNNSHTITEYSLHIGFNGYFFTWPTYSIFCPFVIKINE